MDSSFVTERLEATCRTFEALDRQLADPSVAADPDQLLTLARERSRLEPLVLDYRQLQNLNHQTLQARELLREHRHDKELEELAQEELASLESQRLVLEERLKGVLGTRSVYAERVTTGYFLDEEGMLAALSTWTSQEGISAAT